MNNPRYGQRGTTSTAMKQFYYWIPLVAGIIVGLSSCEKDASLVVNDNQQKTSTSSYTPQSVGYSNSESNDPEGTIWYNISTTQNMRLSLGDYTVSLNWYSPADIEVSSEIVRVGKVAGLNKININSIPEVGWTSQSACEPGYAYIIRRSTYNNGFFYGAIYVVDHIYSGEGIVGAKIKYCPFTPNVGWNK